MEELEILAMPLALLLAIEWFGPILLNALADILRSLLPLLVLAAVASITALLVCVIRRYGESIARWYYFAFHPHPAEPIVKQALTGDTALDGPALASALAELPPGNSIFRQVRFEQAEALVTKMQAMSRTAVHEYEDASAEGYERAAAHAANEAVALAAAALETAKAARKAAEVLKRGGGA